MRSDWAEAISKSRCAYTPGQPVHLTMAVVEELLGQRERTADSLQWLRQHLTAGETTVDAREMWNRLCPRYFDPASRDRDELVPD
jgi:hypothetical protein